MVRQHPPLKPNIPHKNMKPKTLLLLLPMQTNGKECVQSAYEDPVREVSSTKRRGSPIQWTVGPHQCTFARHRCQ